MSLSTGIALGPKDLMARVKVFAEANGWTTLYSAPVINYEANRQNWAFKKTIQSVERFFYMQALDDVLEINIVGMTGWDASTAVIKDNGLLQPEATENWAKTNYLQAPMRRYWIFGDTDYIHVIIEMTTNVFGHFGVGVVVKQAPYVGGEYTYGTWNYTYNNAPMNYSHSYNAWPFDSYPDHESGDQPYFGAIRAVGDGAPGGWNYFTNSNLTDVRMAKGQTRQGSYIHDLIERSGPIDYSGQGMLIPNYLFVRYYNIDQWGYVGRPQAMRVCNMDTFAPAESFLLGSDTWWAFPIRSKSALGLNSDIYGLAFKEVP